jgi:hypothetical protein
VSVARGIAWLGVRTERLTEMRTFFGMLAGEPWHDEPGFVVFDLPNGDRLELFAADDELHSFFAAPVAEFLVEDVDVARSQLELAGIEFIGEIHRGDDGNAWSHCRGPDGNVYGLTSMPDHPAHGRH